MFSTGKSTYRSATEAQERASCRSRLFGRRALSGVLVLALVAGSILSLGLIAGGCSDESGTSAGSNAASVVSAPDTITVVGEAKVETAPDEAVLALGVESDGKDPSTAMNKNSAAVTAALARIKQAGVDDKDIETSNVSVYAVRTYSDNGQEKLVGYRATNSITVTVRDVVQVGKVLSAAVEAGINNVSGPTWRLSDDTESTAAALTQAAKNAKKKAEALAGSLDVHLGGVVMMTENSVQGPIYPAFADSASSKDLAGAVADTPISAGTMEITATVTVTFALKH